MANPEKNILIVEDDKDQAQALAMHAKGKGYLPKIAYDTITGQMMLRQFKIDLVLLDLGLPGGGGILMLENMKRSYKTQDIPVVVLTAKIEAGLEEKAREMGVSEYFVKPCPMEKLFGAIDAILQPPAKS
jgi:DNA-binding response OmpR family regulator